MSRVDDTYVFLNVLFSNRNGLKMYIYIYIYIYVYIEYIE